MKYWAPKLRSVVPGEWIQFANTRRIAIIRQVEAGHPPRRLLLAETWATDQLARAFIGYFPPDALKLAAETVWQAWTTYQAEQRVAEPEEDKADGTASTGQVDWHPLLNAEERTPGVWTMIDAAGRDYGVVRIIREGNAIVYVCELRGERLGGRNVRLRDAVAHVHQAYVARQRSPRRDHGHRGALQEAVSLVLSVDAEMFEQPGDLPEM